MEAVFASTARCTKAVTQRLVTTKESAVPPLPVCLPTLPHYYQANVNAFSYCCVFYSVAGLFSAPNPADLHLNLHPQIRKQFSSRGL